MKIKMFYHFLFFCVSLSFSDVLFAGSIPGQSIQISTNFTAIMGSPTWLIVLRDVNTGEVFPYIFDIKKKDNHWIAYTTGPSYRVTASTLTFGPFAKIKNVCNIEDGVLSGKSMGIIMTGVLSPDPNQFRCRVVPYNN